MNETNLIALVLIGVALVGCVLVCLAVRDERQCKGRGGHIECHDTGGFDMIPVGGGQYIIQPQRACACVGAEP